MTKYGCLYPALIFNLHNYVMWYWEINLFDSCCLCGYQRYTITHSDIDNERLPLGSGHRSDTPSIPHLNLSTEIMQRAEAIMLISFEHFLSATPMLFFVWLYLHNYS